MIDFFGKTTLGILQEIEKKRHRLFSESFWCFSGKGFKYFYKMRLV